LIPAGDGGTPDGNGSAAHIRPASEQLMSVYAKDDDTAIVVVVDGAVDALTVPRLRYALHDAFARLDGRVLVIDLSAVRFFGSPDLRTLSASATEAALHHRGVRPLRIVVDSSRPMIRPIEIVGLDGVLSLYHDVEAALRDSP
jgi:anti-sigma B factor antagonist